MNWLYIAMMMFVFGLCIGFYKLHKLEQALKEQRYIIEEYKKIVNNSHPPSDVHDDAT